jgi:glutathione synthase/RimK-type ligase-like ATP-grasp enzyme
MAKSSLLLIVTHGEGGGPGSRFVDPVLHHIRQTNPDLGQSIAVHPTGEAAPSLDGVACVFFALHGPLKEAYPACFREATAIEERAKQAGIRVVNPPRALSNTVKSVQAEIWVRGGIPTPPHAVFESREALRTIARPLTYPIVVKSDQLHRQKGMRVCRDEAELLRAIEAKELEVPIAVAPFIDTRQGYREQQPGSIWAEFYHKKRTFVLGEIVHPRHVLFSREPIVGLNNCTLSPYRPREKAGAAITTRLLRKLFGHKRDFERDRMAQQSILEDNAFFDAQPEEAALLRKACRLLGLEVAAIDYSVGFGGEIVLWEANANFNLVAEKNYLLSEERNFAERRRRILEDGERFFKSLIPFTTS